MAYWIGDKDGLDRYAITGVDRTARTFSIGVPKRRLMWETKKGALNALHYVQTIGPYAAITTLEIKFGVDCGGGHARRLPRTPVGEVIPALPLAPAVDIEPLARVITLLDAVKDHISHGYFAKAIECTRVAKQLAEELYSKLADYAPEGKPPVLIHRE